MELYEIEKIVKSKLSEKRYYHSKCVMEMCEKLAMIWKVDLEKAKKVGIAHDIAKEMPKEEKLKYIQKYNIEVDEVEKVNLGLLHAKIGAKIAKDEFGFDDEMSKAIEAHTTGKKGMSQLAKVLYLADWIGEDRDFYDTERLRKKAFKDIDAAIIYSLCRSVKEKINEKALVHPDSIFLLNDLLSKRYQKKS